MTLSRRAIGRSLTCDVRGAHMKSVFAGVFAISMAACSRPAINAQWPSGPAIDLSHDYSEQTVFWPTAEPFKLEKVSDGMTEQGYYYAANNFSTSEHGGTHLDAPVHFAKGHRSVDQIPLNQLAGGAVVVDVTVACADQPDYRVTIDDFTGWERSNGAMAGGVAPGERRRPRHGQHRLRAVDAVRDAPDAVRARHSGVREPDESRSPAGHRRVRRRAADEDQGRQRSAIARDRLRAALVTGCRRKCPPAMAFSNGIANT